MDQKHHLNQAYLSIGSNIEPETNLLKAVNMLASHGRISALSKVWETRPVGNPDQPNFLNAVVLLETPASAQHLKDKVISQIERSLGRIRTEDKNAPRTIDIDIVLFNHDILSIGQSSIPSPEVLERAFVAIPLAEISPDYIHPQSGQPLADIASRFDPDEWGMKTRSDISIKKVMELQQKGKLINRSGYGVRLNDEDVGGH
jgi:2-amino-4-hydroxy-6-hydroxymethyldihydropteridine diphosphokinase